jgi:hypothetical protein
MMPRPTGPTQTAQSQRLLRGRNSSGRYRPDSPQEDAVNRTPATQGRARRSGRPHNLRCGCSIAFGPIPALVPAPRRFSESPGMRRSTEILGSSDRTTFCLGRGLRLCERARIKGYHASVVGNAGTVSNSSMRSAAIVPKAPPLLRLPALLRVESTTRTSC